MTPNADRDASRSRRIPRGWLFWVLLAAWPALPLGGCAGPGYYAQAIAGHLRLMRGRVDAAEFIADADAHPELSAEVRQAEALLAFAHDRLDLPESDSFRQVVVTGRDAVTWNVVAAPEFSVEPRRWCFPVAGCVPYRGYFDRADAQAFAARRAARGDDVLVSPATAYSTLGWFADPLLDTMLRGSDADLAVVLFHELAHERLYLRGDTAFNEAYASFVAAAGLRRWARDTGRADLAEAWARRQQAARAFSDLLQRTRQTLERLYASPLDEGAMRARKQAVFAALREDYQRLVREAWDGNDYFGGWLTGDLNNAHLALMQQYRGGECAFAELFREAGADFGRFHALAEAHAEWSDKARERWLETPCEAFASATDL